MTNSAASIVYGPARRDELSSGSEGGSRVQQLPVLLLGALQVLLVPPGGRGDLGEPPLLHRPGARGKPARAANSEQQEYETPEREARRPRSIPHQGTVRLA